MTTDLKNINSDLTNPQACKVYVRELDATSYQTDYQPSKLISQIFFRIYQRQIPNDWLLISKGKRLEPKKSLLENNINSGSIIHILKLNPQNEQRATFTVYISYQDKLHKIQLGQQEKIAQLKQKIQKLTKVQAKMQVLLYNGCFLEEDKEDRNISEYGLKNQDVINMGKIQQNAQNPTYSFPRRIFPININHKNRRNSQEYPFSMELKQQTQIQCKFTQSSYDFTQNSRQEKNILRQQANNLKLGPEQFQIGLIQQKGLKCQQINLSITQNKILQQQVKSYLKTQKSSPGSIFASNNFQQQPLDFNLNLQADYQNNEQNKGFTSPFNFVKAFNDLMLPGKQQLIFCQSYYQQQEVGLQRLKNFPKQKTKTQIKVEGQRLITSQKDVEKTQAGQNCQNIIEQKSSSS